MVKKSDIQIFLAHAHQDKEAVLELYDRLKKAGYKPWLDEKDLIPGQNWRSVIPRVIKDSQLFIACLSTRSISKRGYVQNEFKFNGFVILLSVLILICLILLLVSCIAYGFEINLN